MIFGVVDGELCRVLVGGVGLSAATVVGVEEVWPVMDVCVSECAR